MNNYSIPPINKYIAEQIELKADCVGNPYFRKSLNKVSESVRKYPLPIEEAKDALCLNGVGRQTVEIIKLVIREYRKKESNGQLNYNGINSNSNSNRLVIPDEFKDYKKPNSVVDILNLVDPIYVDSYINKFSKESLDIFQNFICVKYEDLKDLGIQIGHARAIEREIEKYKKYCEFENRNPNIKNIFNNEEIDVQMGSFNVPSCGYPVLSIEDIKRKCTKEVFDSAENDKFNLKIQSIHFDEPNNQFEAISESHSNMDKTYILKFKYNSNNVLIGDSCTCINSNYSRLWCKHKVSVFLVLDFLKQDSRYFRLYIEDQENNNPIKNNNNSNNSPIKNNDNSNATTSKSPNNSKKNSSKINLRENSNGHKILNIFYDQSLMDKIELTKEDAQYNCEKYFRVEDFGNAWSSNINKLKKSKYIMKVLDKYSLTQEGFNMVKSLNNKSNKISHYFEQKDTSTSFQEDQDNDDDENEEESTLFGEAIIKSEKDKKVEKLLFDWSESDEEFTNAMCTNSAIPSNSVKELIYPEKNLVIDEIMLVVDNREIKQKEKSELLKGLNAKNINYEIRQLPMGDFIFVAKCRYQDDPKNKQFELLADIIIERKSIPDLESSIKDGRYKEQKFQLKKLKKFGIKNIVYLVEGIMDGSYMTYEQYQNELIITQIDDGFTVQITESIMSTVYYLHNVYEVVSKYRYLSSLEYNDFINIGESPSRLRDVFAQQLLQIPSMNPQKVYSVIRKYPTPALLVNKYQNCIEIDRKSKTKQYDKEKQLHLLDQRVYSSKKHKLGSQLSEKFYYLYNSDNYNDINKSK